MLLCVGNPTTSPLIWITVVMFSGSIKQMPRSTSKAESTYFPSGGNLQHTTKVSCLTFHWNEAEPKEDSAAAQPSPASKGVLSEFFQWTEPSSALIKWGQTQISLLPDRIWQKGPRGTTLRKKSVMLGVLEHIYNPSFGRLKREDGNFKAKLGYK